MPTAAFMQRTHTCSRSAAMRLLLLLHTFTPPQTKGVDWARVVDLRRRIQFTPPSLLHLGGLSLQMLSILIFEKCLRELGSTQTLVLALLSH
jgi:hypothetical protein